jgi:ABC-type transport system involved in multi-copper enzyme maturation permease subunit
MKALLRVHAVASNTWREAIRNRAFIGLMIVAVGFLFFSLALAELAVRGEAARVVLDFGYFAISLFGVVIAIVMGVILVYKEIEKKTIYTILPKPIHRHEVLLGKYLGMVVVLVIEVVVMAAVWAFVLWARDAPLGMDTVMGVVLILFEIMLIASVALLFSSFSSPVLSGIFTFGIFILGRLSYLVSDMLVSSKGIFVNTPSLRPIGEVYVAVFPDLSVFNVSQDLLQGVSIPAAYVVASGAYALSYIIVFMALAMLLFQRRDFI